MSTDAQDPGARARRTNALPPPKPADVSRAVGVREITIDWLAGDGSDRCYYRIRSPQLPGSYVLMQLSESDAKNLAHGEYDWVKMCRLLDECSIRVPRLVKLIPDHAALVIEDYGDVMLETVVHELMRSGDFKGVDAFFELSFGIIAAMLVIPRSKDAVWCQRAFDQERLTWEMTFFLKHYVDSTHGVALSAEERAAFLRESEELARFLGGRPQYFVHRDFHTRNLMVRDGELAVIDFQDARLGPAAYDLVSLCFDSYVPLTLERRLELMALGINHIAKHGGNKLGTEIGTHWQAMLLQRQLKAIGSFGYLTIAKKRGNYLRYVLPALMTLDSEVVADERWPFISTTLIERMRAGVKG